MTQQSPPRAAGTRLHALATSLATLLAAVPAHASFLHGETLAKAANVIAIVVIVVVPIVLVVAFWLVHILPEKIAHQRQHPQGEAIQVLCLLSLVFGGMLWPLAWLWAYSKPVLYKMAYGTDKAEADHAAPATHGGAEAQDLGVGVARLRADLDKLVAQDGAPRELSAIRDRLAALEPRLAGKVEEAR
jgi:CBS domain containing-hemolysin-like protein